MTRVQLHVTRLILLGSMLWTAFACVARADVGVGARPIAGAEVIFDGTRRMLDEKWTYWDGPRFSSALPIKWKIVDDPLDEGTVLMTDDPAAAGGRYGTADVVTKKKFRDFRLHVEFLVVKPGGNSGVYLQNRYEIQILDGDKSKHGMGAVINETEAPYHAYNGAGKWNAYDITFRAARFEDGKRSQKALVSMFFNGIKVHTNQPINQVWGGRNSGLDGGNDGGRGITDTPGGLKLQCEGHEVLYRNIWIKELDLAEPDTGFEQRPDDRGGASHTAMADNLSRTDVSAIAKESEDTPRLHLRSTSRWAVPDASASAHQGGYSSATYGSSPMNRARSTARRTAR